MGGAGASGISAREYALLEITVEATAKEIESIHIRSPLKNIGPIVGMK